MLPLGIYDNSPCSKDFWVKMLIEMQRGNVRCAIKMGDRGENKWALKSFLLLLLHQFRALAK